MNPGTVDVGVDGLIQFTGQNVDLTRGRLTMDSSGVSVFGTGYFGLNVNTVTNGNTIYIDTPGWDPSIYLGPNYAESALFPIQPIYLYLPNFTAFFQIDSPNPSNNIIRSVFIEDTSGSNVAYNVYFDTAGAGFGGGNVTIEWTGSYQDIATGNYFNNYLYLNNNYLESVSTNDGTLGAVPFNFTFTESATKQIFQTPAPAGFQNVFPSGVPTNRYAFMNAQLHAGTTTPDQVVNLAVTNLPGRIQINASHELNLAHAQINGPNYMSLQSTNHFDGSPGASIQVPYSDLNLAVTNGSLTISNILSPDLPGWSGTCQAWSTRWTTTSTNTVVTFTNTPPVPVATNTITVTNDFRVLIVGSRLNPTTVAQVQDLLLRGTNTVISDAFNLMRTFTSDAQSLTLTTNGFARGATSLDGELNGASPNIFWASSLPNLRNLTNYGAIRFQNLSQFIGISNNAAVTPAVAATGTLSEVNGSFNAQAGNKVVIGTNAYVFVGAINNAVPNQVEVAAAFDGTMNNLIAAINGAAGAGTAYSTATTANAQVAAGLLTSHAFTVAAKTSGSMGNSIQTALSGPTTNLTWSSSYLAGGVDGVTNVSSAQVPYRNFVNHGLLSDQGSQIWADNFESSGAISNGSFGSFVLQSRTATLTNGLLYAGGDVSINTLSLVTSNLVLQAGRSLTLVVSNQITDTGVTNGNVWTVGAASGGEGLTLPILPATAGGGGTDANSLLGTTINLVAATNVNLVNTWAGVDLGASPAGYTNNVAVGHLILDATGQAAGTQFYFNGTGASNAIYVDRLELRDYASWTNHDSHLNLAALAFNTNLVIYYADAIAAGTGSGGQPGDVSEQINHKNGDHLRWVPTYAGYFSSTNLVVAGVTNTYNVALATSTVIDSDGDGIENAFDPTPFFLPGMINLTAYPTNNPAHTIVISFDTIPRATNTVFYTTSLMQPVIWTVLTNIYIPVISTNPFVSMNYPGPATNNPFISPQLNSGPATNVMVFDPAGVSGRYYQVMVYPWLTYPY